MHDEVMRRQKLGSALFYGKDMNVFDVKRAEGCGAERTVNRSLQSTRQHVFRLSEGLHILSR